MVEIELAILTAVLSLVGWFLRQKFVSYDVKHMQHFQHASTPDIHQHAMNREAVELRLESIAKEVTHFRQHLEEHISNDLRNLEVNRAHIDESGKSIQWIGDCLLTLAITMKIKLPDRPS